MGYLFCKDLNIYGSFDSKSQLAFHLIYIFFQLFWSEFCRWQRNSLWKTDRNSVGKKLNAANITPILSTMENSFQPDPGRVHLGYEFHILIRKFTYFIFRFYYRAFLSKYHKFMSSRPVYYSILDNFDQRSQYIRIEFPLYKQSENTWM